MPVRGSSWGGAPRLLDLLPDDWVVDTIRSAGGDEVRFNPAHGGAVETRAVMSVLLLASDTTEEAAFTTVAGRAEELGIDEIVSADLRHPWSLVEYAGYADGYISALTLGRHADDDTDAFFVVLVRYPGEFGDGFHPRERLVLDHWIWTETGEPLTTSGPRDGV